MNYKKINDEVYYTQDIITKVDRKDIDFLKSLASQNKRKRVRLCTHKDTNDLVHEMLIVHALNCYVPPHKHLNKSESFHIIEGALKIILFDDDGEITEIIRIGDHASGGVLYYRLSESFFHTVLPSTEWVVFHEVTKGPFDRDETVFAPWAPKEDDFQNQGAFLNNLQQRISALE